VDRAGRCWRSTDANGKVGVQVGVDPEKQKAG
jgi:hypothetical protein